jgi:hypothetical protein
MNPAECCSNKCNPGGKCAGCQPDGAACMLPGDCCNGQCSNGICGAPACPSDGTPCGECLATSCCNQLSTCLASPNCQVAVACFFNCVANGGGPIQCGFQCQILQNPQAQQLLGCLVNNCGAGTCF